MEPSPSSPNCWKDYWKLLPLLVSINWPSLVTSWVVVQKIYSKMYLVSCTNTHHDITDSVNHGMVQNTKIWVSVEQNIIFLQNKKVLNICFRWHILISYHFVAEVTFKGYARVLNFQGYIETAYVCKHGRVFKTLGCNYGSILGFQICQVSAYVRTEYALIWLNNAWINCSDYGRVLNMPGQSFIGFQICLWF